MGFPESTLAASHTGLGELRHVAVTRSTNTDLADEAKNGGANPAVLVADHQTHGRGRLERTWHDQGGSLLASVRMPIDPIGAGQAMMAVAASIRQVLDVHTTAHIRVKWPNDLVISTPDGQRKLAGVLAELVIGSPSVLVVGFGINLTSIEAQPDATSMLECGADVGRDRLLAEILTAIGQHLGDPAVVHRDLRAHSATIGYRVRVELPGGRFVAGEATDLDSDGRLLVEDEVGVTHSISAGDAIRLRPEA